MRDPVTAEVLAAAVAATDAGVLVCDRGLPDTPVVFANDGFCRMTGYPREEVLGRNCRFLQGPGTDRDAVARLRDAIAAGRPVEAELLNYRRDGGPFWNALRIGPVADGDGPARFLVGVLHDVTGRRRAEDRVADLGRRLDALAASGVVGIMVAEGERIVEANAEFLRTVGYGPEDLAAGGLHWPSMTPPEWRERSRRGEEDAVVGGASRPYEKEYLRKDGGRVPVLIGAVALDRSRRRRMCLVLDLSERKRAEERVRHLAHHDPLTGLPNRALFHDRLRQALAQAGRHGERAALLLLDLDRFKDVNDTLGHDAGDALLREVARRLLGRVREGDTVARLGGDEFALVLSPPASPRAAAELAARVGAALAEPVEHAGIPVHTGVSVGVTLFPDDGEEPERLLKNADVALYRAKAEGRGTCRFFVPDMRLGVERRRALEDELRSALARGELEPFYQPKVRLADDRVVGFEALVRWRHPTRGLVGPDEFLPVAEEAGLGAAVSDLVLRQAVARARAWQEAGLELTCLAVNLAPAQFRRGGLARTVRSVLDEAGLAPGCLMVEVTEGVFLGRDAGRVTEELEALHATGVTVALDDFGTGYASLAHLRRFPIGALKVDRSFVRDLLVDPGDATIVRAVVGLGHSLGMRVVAEGVEDEGQLAWLRLQGCDYAQGTLLGPAMPAEEVPGWLARRRGQEVTA